VPGRVHQGVTRATLRIVNDRQEVDFYYRLPDQGWKKMQESAEIAGMDHNVLGGFLDVRPALFAAGEGHAIFRGFRYWPEVQAPG
jgi:xylan 1,4-beta-xylosidase